MFLAVDSGNTRVKWALCGDDGSVAESGAFPAGRISGLERIAPRADACRAAHVGGEGRREKLRAALSACADLEFARSEKRAGGVFNHYNPTESLGVDRWLALLAVFAARVNGEGGKEKGWVIVSAGTATTIDGLTAGGDFIGGFILPGLSSFPLALARSTALPREALFGGGDKTQTDARPPCSTADAVGRGALCAAAGAALEYRRRFLRGAEFILTGGDAERLSAWLPEARVIPDLVVRGLIVRHFGGGKRDGGQ